MKIVRFLFAPLFWLRDIRNSLAQIERLRRWEYCLRVCRSSLSTNRKKELLDVMLKAKDKGKGTAAEGDVTSTAILKCLEIED